MPTYRLIQDIQQAWWEMSVEFT